MRLTMIRSNCSHNEMYYRKSPVFKTFSRAKLLFFAVLNGNI